MSETLNRAPSEAVYDDWQVQAYKALGEKVQANEKAKAALANGFIPDQKTIRDKPLPPIQYSGKPAPDSWIGKQLAGQLFGDPDDRAGRTLKKVDGKDVDLHGQNCQKIGAMLNDGTAAAVKIIGEGKRQLRGNFFSADGYNLKNNDNKADTSRPVVLLLTGSGGSAEEQGFDVASFYTANGASVLSVNYAGFGGNAAPAEGTSELSMQQDAQSMLQHLINLGYDPDKIIIHGYSLGAAVAAELQRANEANDVKFRGAVQDRPMLSAVHGVEGHFTKAMHPAAALTRDKVGGFQGERAIMQLDPQTPMVITSDKGRFATRADELREKLKKNHSNVSGEHSGGGHFDHKKMLEANKEALVGVITAGGNGGQIGDQTEPDEMAYEKLVRTCERAIVDIRKGAADAAAKFADLPEAGSSSAAMELRKKVLELIGDLVDVLNYAPVKCPEIAQLQPAIQGAMGELERLAVALRAKATTDTNKPSVCTQEVDIAAARAADVLDRIAQAGGLAAASKELKDEVVKVWRLMMGLGIRRKNQERMRGDLRDLFDELYAAMDEIGGYYVL
jgi:acetyl esterase/lipase